jgi:DDE superfamily endonuclease
LDGYSSYVSIEFIELAYANNIELFAFVPHTTHICQPLDVGCFSANKKIFGSTVDDFASKRARGSLSKRDFFEIYAIAHTKSITASNITSSFVATGIYPWCYEPISPGPAPN